MMFDSKSLFDLISDKRKQEFADSTGPGFDEMDSMEPEGHPDDEHGFRLELRRKRKTALLKRMLMDGGYGDLSKFATVRSF